MFGILRKLSGESQTDSTSMDVRDQATPDSESKKGKRNRSGTKSDESVGNGSKRKKLVRSKANVSKEEGEIGSSDDEPDAVDSNSSTRSDPSAAMPGTKLPPETPEWGLKLFELIQNEFCNMTHSIAATESSSKQSA